MLDTNSKLCLLPLRSLERFYDTHTTRDDIEHIWLSNVVGTKRNGRLSIGSLLTPLSPSLINSLTETTMIIEDNTLAAQHDMLSDIFVAPLGRIAGLRAQLFGVSATTMSYKVDKDHDRLKLKAEIIKGFSDFFAQEPNDLYSRTEIKIELKIEQVEEHLSDGGINYQLAVVKYVTKTDNKPERRLLAFTRFNDAGTTHEGTIRFVAFKPEAIGFTKELLHGYAPVKEYTMTTLDAVGTEVRTNAVKISPKDAILHDSFYPFIEGGASNLIQEFYESRSNLMIFTGIHGSGKSSLYRCMLNFNTEGKFFVIDNPGIYKNADQLSLILDHLRTAAMDSQVTVALEEIDPFVKEKNLDNVLLPRLLSIAAGVVSSNIKFVIMANVPTQEQYAEELTREGRTFAAVNFRDLTPDEANAARADFGLEALEFEDRVTLATALNTKKAKVKRRMVRMGFTS